MHKSLPPSRVSTLSAWTFSVTEHSSNALLRNHFVLTNIPLSADNHICMWFKCHLIDNVTQKPIYAHSEESTNKLIFQ